MHHHKGMGSGDNIIVLDTSCMDLLTHLLKPTKLVGFTPGGMKAGYEDVTGTSCVHGCDISLPLPGYAVHCYKCSRVMQLAGTSMHSVMQ